MPYDNPAKKAPEKDAKKPKKEKKKAYPMPPSRFQRRDVDGNGEKY